MRKASYDQSSVVQSHGSLEYSTPKCHRFRKNAPATDTCVKAGVQKCGAIGPSKTSWCRQSLCSVKAPDLSNKVRETKLRRRDEYLEVQSRPSTVLVEQCRESID